MLGLGPAKVKLSGFLENTFGILWPTTPADARDFEDDPSKVQVPYDGECWVLYKFLSIFFCQVFVLFLSITADKYIEIEHRFCPQHEHRFT